MSITSELARLVVNIVGDKSSVMSALAAVKEALKANARDLDQKYELRTAEAQERLGKLGEALAGIRSTLLSMAGIDLSAVLKLASFAGWVASLGMAGQNFARLHDNALRLRNTLEAIGADRGAEERITALADKLAAALRKSSLEARTEIGNIMQQSMGQVGPDEAAKLAMTAAGAARRRGMDPHELQGQLLWLMRMEQMGGAGEGGAGAARHLRILKMTFGDLLKDAKDFNEIFARLSEYAGPGLEALDKDAGTFDARLQNLKLQAGQLWNQFSETFGPPLLAVLEQLMAAVSTVTDWFAGLLSLLQDSGWGEFVTWTITLAGTLALVVGLVAALRAGLGLLNAFMVGPMIAGIARVVVVLYGAVAAMTKWIAAKTVALALEGPSGWAKLAAAGVLAVAGITAAVVGINAAHDKMQAKMAQTQAKAADLNKSLGKMPKVGGGGGSEMMSFKAFEEKLFKASLAAAGPKADDPVKATKRVEDRVAESNKWLKEMAQARRIAGTVGVAVAG